MSFATISELFMKSVETYKEKDAYFEKINGEWIGLSYGDVEKLVGRFAAGLAQDRKSTRLNSSHKPISYAVFCLKKKNITTSH